MNEKKAVELEDLIFREEGNRVRDIIDNFKKELQKIKKEHSIQEKPRFFRLGSIISSEEDPYEFLDVVLFLQDFQEKTQELNDVLTLIKKKTESTLMSEEEEEHVVDYYGSFEGLIQQADKLSEELESMKTSEYFEHPFVQAYFTDKVSLRELKYLSRLDKHFDVGSVRIDDKPISMSGIKFLISKTPQERKGNGSGNVYFHVKNTLTPVQYLLLLILREFKFSEETDPVTLVEELFETFLIFLLKCCKLFENTEIRSNITIFLMRLFFADEMLLPEEVLLTKQKRLARMRYKRKQLMAEKT